MRRLAHVLVLTLALAGCRGVPIGHYRYRASAEPVEVLLGLVALPFAVAGDVLLNYLFLADPTSWTEYALSLISPFHNAIDAGVGPTECPALEEGVRVTRARRHGELQGDATAILAAARASLEATGWTLEPTREGRSPWKLHTAWVAEPATRSATKEPPALMRRLHVRVYPPERPHQPVAVRARLELAARAGALVEPSRFAALQAQLAAAERAQDEAEEELEDEEGDVSLISYHSFGDEGEERYRDEVDARRDPHRRDVESAADDILEVEDELFRAQVLATREELARRSDDPLRTLWDGLTRAFPPAK